MLPGDLRGTQSLMAPALVPNTTHATLYITCTVIRSQVLVAATVIDSAPLSAHNYLGYVRHPRHLAPLVPPTLVVWSPLQQPGYLHAYFLLARLFCH